MAQYDVTLRDYWRILRRRKGIVLFTAFVLGFFSLVIATIWKPVPMYRATAKIQLNSQQGSGNALAQLSLSSYSESSDLIETQLAIIASFPVLKEAARELDFFGATQTIEDTAVVALALQGQISAAQQGQRRGVFELTCFRHRQRSHLALDEYVFALAVSWPRPCHIGTPTQHNICPLYRWHLDPFFPGEFSL